MKVTVNSKKGLKTSLSIFVDKKTIQKKMDEKLNEYQDKVHLKGFRPGKVPQNVIKNQFGKAIYGEVIDLILKETSSKAIEEKKIKVAGQPKIDLKTFGEGKDLDYTMEFETLPEVKLKSLDKIKATDYEIIIENHVVDKRIKEISKNQKNYLDKSEKELSEKDDMIIFDYTAQAEGKDFEGNEGKNIQIILGKDLFLKGFDNQLIGVKRNETKNVSVSLPENYPKKELANKKTEFKCKIINIKKPTEAKIDDEFAKKLGAKDLLDLKKLIKDQISKEYKNTLDAITKKNILEQIEKLHTLDLPKNLVEQEVKIISQNLKKEDSDKFIDKNTSLAKSRIKTGLILNEIAEKNNLKINEDEIKNEIQKQVKTMPGQEKMIMEYYQKNPSAIASLRGALYEEKIIGLIKNKITLNKQKVTMKQAEDILNNISKSQKPAMSKNENIKKNPKKLKIKKKK
tara:strand:- start:6777 stop:8144 length:1368 start_codon:yes stop_codon:yes gene_type:complete